MLSDEYRVATQDGGGLWSGHTFTINYLYGVLAWIAVLYFKKERISDCSRTLMKAA